MKKIGEVLVDRGLITRSQLDKALKAQLILGGHLGTSLIELDYLDEDVFGEVLAEHVGLPRATHEDLTHILPRVIHSVDWKLVEKHKIVPFRLDNDALHVAVIDPRSLDSLSTVTGYRILPHIAPEIRVFEAMERYYDIPRRPRYIGLCHELERQAALRVQGGAPRDRARVAEGAVAAASKVDAAPPIDVDKSTASTPTADDLGAEFGYGRSWRDIAEDIEPSAERDMQRPEASVAPAAKPADAAAGKVAGPAAPNPDADPEGAAGLWMRMSRADDKNDLARDVLAYLAPRARAAILFAVRRETASLWRFSGFDLDDERAAGLRLPVTSGSIFTLLLGSDHYRGAVPEELACRWFYGALGLDVPAEVVLLPVYLNDRLVAILYADGGTAGAVGVDTDTLRAMARKLGLALNVLVLRIKIRGD